MAVSKRLRFEVFRRDNHACRYCGGTAPEVKLSVDHVTPVALGGSDDPSNLVTACEPCNSGKSSVPADAALVANVSEDAVRWAQAIKVAGDRMLAKFDDLETARDQFDSWWTNWGIGEGDARREIPRPANWRNTVDMLTAAGLPLQVLKGCVDKAMGMEKVRTDGKFRYMCGIAWGKVKELQKTAQETISDETTEPEGAPEAAELIKEIMHDCLDTKQIDEAMEFASESCEDDDDEIDFWRCALEYALGRLVGRLNWLTVQTNSLLASLPRDVASAAVDEATETMEHGRAITEDPYPVSDYEIAGLAALLASAALNKRFFESRSTDEQQAWRTYLNTASRLPQHRHVSEDDQMRKLARLARSKAAGESLRLAGMCPFPDRNNPTGCCMNLGVFNVTYEPGPDDEPDVPIREVACERHLQESLDGKRNWHGGGVIVVIDYESVKFEDEKVPS